MFQRLQSAIRVRAFAVLLLLHLGAAAQLYGLFAPEIDSERRAWMWAGFAGLYGAFVLGALFVLVPALPWIQKARRVSRWREWILQELPEILALIPVILQALQALRDAWAGFEQGLDATPGQRRQPKARRAPAPAMGAPRTKPKSRSRAKVGA